jgi:hypothetical protein
VRACVRAYVPFLLLPPPLLLLLLHLLLLLLPSPAAPILPLLVPVSQSGRPSVHCPVSASGLARLGLLRSHRFHLLPFPTPPPLPSCRFSFSSSARLALSRRLVQLPCLSVALESPAPRLGSHSAADPIDADVCPSSLDFTLPSLFFLANHTRGFQFQFQIECPAPISTTTFPPLSSSHTYLALPYLTLLTYLTYPPTHPAAGWLAY